MSMIYGYARVSTKAQAKDGNSLTVQNKELKQAGAVKIFTDTYTGYTTDRPELDKLLDKVKGGDTIIVTKLDRIARHLKQGIELIDSLVDRGVNIHVLNMGLIDNSPTGELIRNVMLAFADFERKMILQRMNEGKEASGNYGGRKRKYTKKQLHHAVELLEQHSYSQVSEMTGISKSTLQRVKKQEELSV